MTYKKGTFVLIRTINAGVHFGTLEEMQVQEVRLSEAQRYGMIKRWAESQKPSQLIENKTDIVKE